MIVTAHAAQRYCERVDPTATLAEAHAAIAESERAVECAAGFGCRVIRLACHAKLILDGSRVLTVIIADRPWTGHRRSYQGDFA